MDNRNLENKNSKDNVVLLKDLKNNMPIPMPGKPSQEFSFINWTMKQEKSIANMKKETGMMGKFVSAVICYMLDTLYGEDFKNKTKDEKIVFINQQDMPNIMYLWVYLRLETLGDEIKLDVICPSCGRNNKDRTFTLNTMDITTKSINDSRISSYKLIKPFMFNDERIETLDINITKWEAMESAKDEVATNEGLLKELIFKNSIIGVNKSEDFIDIESLIENLHKIDIESLSNAISKHNGGPALTLSDKCVFCGAEYFRFLNWSYDYFFAASSLPEK